MPPWPQAFRNERPRLLLYGLLLIGYSVLQTLGMEEIMRQSIIAVLLLFVWNSASAEEARRGLITSTSCPYTCKDAGIPAADCRERRQGDRCEVEDLRQAPGHRTLYRDKAGAGRAAASTENARGSIAPIAPTVPASGQRGLITSSSCPYDCAMAGVPAAYCRAWESDGRCNVEDLRQAPGHRTLLQVKR